MSKANRTAGIRPGSARNISEFINQVDQFRIVLGSDAWPSSGLYPGAQAGALGPENFAEAAAILETKIDFSTGFVSSGHQHPYASVGSGVRLARNSVSDVQLDWSAGGANCIPFIMGYRKGMIIRAGHYAMQAFDKNVNYYPRKVARFGGETSHDHFELDIPFSVQDKNEISSSGAYEQRGGSPFPVGSVPVVLYNYTTRSMLQLDAEIATAQNAGPATYDAEDFASAIVYIDHEKFKLRYWFRSADGNSGNLISYIDGVYWIAIYDPTAESPY